MLLSKYSNSVVLKELSLRNLNNFSNLDLNFIDNVNVKIFLSLNNYNSLKNFNSSLFIFSYFFSSLLFNNFRLKLSFSKKIFIKRRKKKIKRQVNGFIFFLENNKNFYSFFEGILYNHSILPLYVNSYKNTVKKSLISDSLNLNINSLVFFNNYFNSLLYFYQLSNNFFISFFYKNNLSNNLFLYFFLRSLGFNLEFKKINK